MTKPLATLADLKSAGPDIIAVKLIHRYDGRAQFVVKYAGKQRTVSFRYSSTNPFVTAIADAFNITENDFSTVMRKRNSADSRVFHIYAGKGHHN